MQVERPVSQSQCLPEMFRFQQIESRWGYSGTSDKIRFIVDRRIFVVGFGLYGSIHGPSEYDVTIQVEIAGIVFTQLKSPHSYS